MLDVLPHASPRINFLGIPLHAVNMPEAVALAGDAMRQRKRLQHGDVNVAKLVQMKEDADLKRYTMESDLICIDGMGIIVGCRLFGLKTRGRVTGIDLMLEAIEVCAREGFRPYFLGAKEQVLRDMVDRLQKQYPGLDVAGFRNGYFGPEDEAQIVAAINEARADCLFVGISSPIKERFLNQYREQLDVPLQMGVGGAFDVVSGNVRRAPVIMQKTGLEWLFRLLQEPRRLLSRYFVTNVSYAGILLVHLWSSATQRPQASKNKS